MNKPIESSSIRSGSSQRSLRNLVLASFAISAFTALAGCGADDEISSNTQDSDSSTVGDVAGRDLVVHEAVAFRVTDGDSRGVAIVLTDRPGACAALQHHAAIASATTLTLFVPDETSPIDNENGGVRALSADLPALGSATPPAATFSARDESCTIESGIGAHSATRGHIDLDQIALTSGARTLGSFDLAFDSDTLVGKFAAVYCDVATTSGDPLAEASACR